MTSKKKKLVTNIIFYTLIVLIYGFVIFQLIVKFNGGVVYLFDTRFDVVLTDSMSKKNENHLDFLDGTSQIQVYDVVSSKKINDNTELNLKDVVLFKNPDLQGRTVMHRIAEITQKYDTLKINTAVEYTFNGVKTISLTTYGSSIYLSDQSLKSIEVEFVSNILSESYFSFNIGGSYVDGELTTTKIDNYYQHKLVALTNTKAAIPTRIVPTILDDAYITKVTYTTNTDRTFDFGAADYIKPEAEIFEAKVNVIDFYKLRGDKAKDFDAGGKEFERSELISKVDNVIPKLGYIVRFLNSIPGMILLIGLAIIITVTSYFYNRIPKKVIDNTTTEIVAEDVNDPQDTIDPQENQAEENLPDEVKEIDNEQKD